MPNGGEWGGDRPAGAGNVEGDARAGDAFPDDAFAAMRVEGRVQGVGFRFWTVRTATGLALRGWVRNLPDGSVEAHFAGSAAAVDAMREALHRGPGGARVDAVKEAGEPTSLPERGFEIR
jgi:acylphosphatase